MVRGFSRRRSLAGSLALILALAAAPPALATPCDGMLPDTGRADPAPRGIVADDLLRLRDIGYSHLAPAQRLLTISPDGRQVAFAMHRADPQANGYCQAIFVAALDGAGKPRMLDSGDELLLEAYPIRGVRVDYGYPKVILPRWSPDGEWIAYLKRVDGIAQIWRAHLRTGRAEPVTRSEIDIEQFAWVPDGRAIVFATRPGIREQQRAIDREGRGGYLFDDRVVPYAGPRPAVRLPVPEEIWTIDLDTGKTRRPDDSERALIVPPPPADPSENLASARASDGSRAWIARDDPQAYLSSLQLWAETGDGRRIRCADISCRGTRSVGITRLWWLPGGRELLFQRREGWDGSETALYRWTPGSGQPRRILVTPDLLIGCELVEDMLLCAREGATAPRHLVRLDLEDGREQQLFDPNPGFARLKLGRVERLTWRNDAGIESFGDLVLPSGYRPGTKLPLIIVQYQSTGLLRGGVGDEYPIQLFAAAGYAVLSFDAPPSFADWDGSKRDFEAAVVESMKDWRSRRNIFSSLERGIELLVARGIVDPKRIGITGFSDGATTVQFGLVNRPDLFAAAAISSCCSEPSYYMIYGGIGLADSQKALGFPPARGPGAEAWKPQSIALNAAAIRAPLLMQLADHESLGGIDPFMALRAQGKPVEMHIFPQEYHLKWQPAHRAAIYERNLDWFDFWLRGIIDPDPAKAAQYARWRAMRPDTPP
jgi:dipeptidyl aminopeptidase/acylaminoacyl peptidase